MVKTKLRCAGASDRGVRLVQASIPMPDSVQLAATLYMPANLRPGEGQTYSYLASLGFSEPLTGSIDQIVVRGLASTTPAAWPAERRCLRGRLLSDHAPIELTVG